MLILASQSPRRHELLTHLGYSFDVHHPDVEEILDPSNLAQSLMGLAARKAQSATAKYSQGLAIGCDTVVELDGQLLGKPIDRTHAKEMLLELSGKNHRVHSAIALVDLQTGKQQSGLESTHIRFRHLSLNEIEHYLDSNEPYDKAGAYAIQGSASIFVEEIHGCLTNVVGFPVSLFLKLKEAAESC